MIIYNDYRDEQILESPSWEELEEMFYENLAEATDGCIVELDGTCEHGHKSWFLVKGLI